MRGCVFVIWQRQKWAEPQNPSLQGMKLGKEVHRGVSNREERVMAKVQKGVGGGEVGGGPKFLPFLFISKKTPLEEGAPGHIYSPVDIYSFF